MGDGHHHNTSEQINIDNYMAHTDIIVAPYAHGSDVTRRLVNKQLLGTVISRRTQGTNSSLSKNTLLVDR